MIKRKATSAAQLTITTIFGYSLFLILIATLLAVYSVRLGAGGVSVVAVYAGLSVVPPLMAYVFGRRATADKNAVVRRYNGVVFAIATFMIAQLLSLVSYTIPQLAGLPFSSALFFTHVIPIIVSVLISGLVAMTCAKPKQQQSILTHGPFQAVTIASVAAYFMLSATSFDYHLDAVILIGLTTIVIPALIIVVAYQLLARFSPSPLSRLTDAMLTLSLGTITLVATYPAFQLLSRGYEVELYGSIAAAVVVIASYLYLRHKTV